MIRTPQVFPRVALGVAAGVARAATPAALARLAPVLVSPAEQPSGDFGSFVFFVVDDQRRR